MKIKTIKTHKITSKDKNIYKILDKYIKKFREKNILVITSKILAICENSIIPIGQVNKEDLIKQESEKYIDKNQNQYGISLSIRNGIIIANAGIDESNGDNNYILWPKDPYKSAEEIRILYQKNLTLSIWV